MNDAPETMWIDYSPYTETYQDLAHEDCGGYTEYTRADLTPTTAQIMAHPKVQALVEALRIVADGHRDDYSDNCNQALAALAALEEKP